MGVEVYQNGTECLWAACLKTLNSVYERTTPFRTWPYVKRNKDFPKKDEISYVSTYRYVVMGVRVLLQKYSNLVYVNRVGFHPLVCAVREYESTKLLHVICCGEWIWCVIIICELALLKKAPIHQ